MAALVSIGGFDFPETSTYNATTSTIVDSARNVQGRVVGDVVRHDVAKIELSWKYLTAYEWERKSFLFPRAFSTDKVQLLFMILLSCQNGEGTVKRFKENNSHQLVWEGQGRNRKPNIALSLYSLTETVG